MTSTDLVISFSFDVWLKLNSLSLQVRDDFLRNFYQILLNSDSQEKISLLSENKSKKILIFSEENILQILALFSFNKEHKLVIKIINIFKYSQDFHSIREKGKEWGVITEIINVVNNFLMQNNNIESLFNDQYQLEKADLAINNNDFYFYFLEDNQLNHLQILSSQQYDIIHQKPSFPVILNGNYGTGKTTTAIYSALKQAHIFSKKGEEKILYVTENKFLVKEIRKISNNIRFAENIDFYHYLSLAKKIIDKYPLIFTQKFLSQRQITLYKFTEKFCKVKKIFVLKPELLWQEIRQTIKGSTKALKNHNGLISLDEYLSIKNQSLLPSNSDFKNIYNLAIEYQNWLESEKYWDELDFTRYLLNKLPDNYLGEYEAIYLDELHKFTELQIELILKLLKSHPHNNNFPQIFLVGNNDINIINNSFIWKKLKKS